MKAIITIIIIGICIIGYGQTKRQPGKVNQNRATQNNSIRTGSSQTGATDQNVQPRQTATDRYLNGPGRNTSTTTPGSSNTTVNSSPFVSGIHAADNASKTFDTVAANRNTANNKTTNTTIAGGNDTTFNVNTISQGGVTTNSGAVERSGQAHFGQTNWGNSRSTVGESQWTIPPPITA
ncbi:MAG: hypothetical protein JWQ09_3828, partial [Segetibacter sp.]|nr:hypothetical protein [Segetibacter sp.]